MRTDVAGVIIALVLAFAGMLSVCAQDAKVSEVRKVDAFSSIEITSVGTIHFTQSDTYSFRIEGRERYVKNTQTTVKDGRLLIGFKDGKNKRRSNQKDGVTIWISAPDLKEVEFTGVGEFKCEKPLKLRLDVQRTESCLARSRQRRYSCNLRLFVRQNGWCGRCHFERNRRTCRYFQRRHRRSKYR